MIRRPVRFTMLYATSFLLVLLTGCAAPAQTASAGAGAATSAADPAHGWPRSTAAAQGLDSVPLAALAARVRSGAMGAVDRLVVVRNGQLVMDERFRPNYDSISRGKSSALGCGVDACTDPASQMHDFNYLHPRYHPWYQGRDVHTLQSVTKSVTATLIGAAMHRGEIRSVSQPLLSFFSAYTLDVDARLTKATLADLLTMRSGIEWHEQDRPLDSTNTTLQLEHSADWIRFTLDQPMDAEPGTKWAYNSGGSALMAEIIRSTTGKHVDKYAEEHLFGPLAIRDYHWKKTPTGHPDTEGGLYLNPLDLAKIGQLYINDGVWNGRRILPAGWAKEATGRHVQNTSANPASPGYGYQWWRYDRRGTEIWAGNGFGGQFLIVVPQHNIVAVANSWNVFGAQVPGILGPFIEAVLNAAGVP